MPAPQDMASQLDELDRFLNAARGVHGPSGVGNAQISVNAGGVAVWMAVVACMVAVAVVLTASIFVAIAVSDLNEQARELRYKTDTIQAYINAGMVQPKEEVNP